MQKLSKSKVVYTNSCQICKKKIPAKARCHVLAEVVLLKGGSFDLYGDLAFFCAACVRKAPVLT